MQERSETISFNPKRFHNARQIPERPEAELANPAAVGNEFLE